MHKSTTTTLTSEVALGVTASQEQKQQKFDIIIITNKMLKNKIFFL
jgi:hypothetical protein